MLTLAILLADMLIFNQFKTILKSIFHFLLELQFVFKEIVSKMFTEIAKGKLLHTMEHITALQYQILQPHSFSHLPLKWLFISK